MYCRHCGREIPDGAEFCPLCGGLQNDGGFSASRGGIAGISKRLIAKIALALALVCFALPFMAVSCSSEGTTVFSKEYSGFQLMTSLGEASDAGEDETAAEKEKDAKPNIYAIVSFALGVTALVLLLIGKRSRICGVLSGVFGAALIALAATFRSYYNLDSGFANTGGNSLFDSADMSKISDMISVDVKYGLIAAVLLFAAAAVCCFLDTENP